MTLNIELTPAQEDSLTSVAMQMGIEPSEFVKRVVTLYLPNNSNTASSPEERIRAMDAFAEKNRGLPVLPDIALDREDLYEDRL